MRIGRAAAVIVALALGITADSCGEFVRNNPFDPAVPVTLTIHGPDSAFAQFDTLHFTVTTDPVYDYDEVEWQVGGLQKIDNNGTYQVGPTTTYGGRPTTIAVTALIGARSVSKNVNLVFRPVGIAARYCTGDSLAVRFSTLGGTWADVCTRILDARGGVISTNVTDTALTVRVLDTTVAQAAFGRIIPVGNGSTKVVFTYKALADTLSVTVRQDVAYLTITPPACASLGSQVLMQLGDTLRLKLGAPAYDPMGYVVTDPSIVQAAAAQVVWYQAPGSPVPISVTSDGLVTATNNGAFEVRARFANSSPSAVLAYCEIAVP